MWVLNSRCLGGLVQVYVSFMLTKNFLFIMRISFACLLQYFGFVMLCCFSFIWNYGLCCFWWLLVFWCFSDCDWYCILLFTVIDWFRAWLLVWFVVWVWFVICLTLDFVCGLVYGMFDLWVYFGWCLLFAFVWGYFEWCGCVALVYICCTIRFDYFYRCLFGVLSCMYLFAWIFCFLG